MATSCARVDAFFGAGVDEGAIVDNNIFYSGTLSSSTPAPFIAIAGVDMDARVHNIFYSGTLSSSTPAPGVDDEVLDNRYDHTLPFQCLIKSHLSEIFKSLEKINSPKKMTQEWIF